MSNRIDGFNIGQDLNLTFKASTGESFNADMLGHLVHFSCDADDTEITVKPISRQGRPLHDRVPHGWVGKIGWARMNGNLTDMLLTIDNNFFDAGVRTKFNLTMSCQNRDGSIDTYLLEGCSFSKASVGDFKADKEVEQGLSFRAQNMRKTSGSTGLINAVGSF